MWWKMERLKTVWSSLNRCKCHLKMESWDRFQTVIKAFSLLWNANKLIACTVGNESRWLSHQWFSFKDCRHYFTKSTIQLIHLLIISVIRDFQLWDLVPEFLQIMRWVVGKHLMFCIIISLWTKYISLPWQESVLIPHLCSGTSFFPVVLGYTSFLWHNISFCQISHLKPITVDICIYKVLSSNINLLDKIESSA